MIVETNTTPGARPHGDLERRIIAKALSTRDTGPDRYGHDHNADHRPRYVEDGYQVGDRTYNGDRLYESWTSELYRQVFEAVVGDKTSDLTQIMKSVEAMLELILHRDAPEDEDEAAMDAIRLHLNELAAEEPSGREGLNDDLHQLYTRRHKGIGATLRHCDNEAPWWLVEGVMVGGGDDYGVLAAEAKAGKTWLALDMAVAVASGRPWVGQYPTTQGAVLLYASEGGAHTLARRIKAIAAHYDVDPYALPIDVITDAPDFTTDDGLDRFALDIKLSAPDLIIVDPLYRASRSVNSASLNEVGAVLGAAQGIAQGAGAALLVVAHWNQTGTGTGAKRITGAGPWEWARVLISMHTNGATDVAVDDTGAKTGVVDLTIEIGGGNLVGETFNLRRTLASHPRDLAAPIGYNVEATETATTDLSAEIVRVVTETPGLTRADLYRPGPTRVGAKNAVGDAVRELLEAAAIEERQVRHPGAHRATSALYPVGNELITP